MIALQRNSLHLAEKLNEYRDKRRDEYEKVWPVSLVDVRDYDECNIPHTKPVLMFYRTEKMVKTMSDAYILHGEE